MMQFNNELEKNFKLGTLEGFSEAIKKIASQQSVSTLIAFLRDYYNPFSFSLQCEVGNEKIGLVKEFLPMLSDEDVALIVFATSPIVQLIKSNNGCTAKIEYELSESHIYKPLIIDIAIMKNHDKNILPIPLMAKKVFLKTTENNPEKYKLYNGDILIEKCFINGVILETPIHAHWLSLRGNISKLIQSCGGAYYPVLSIDNEKEGKLDLSSVTADEVIATGLDIFDIIPPQKCKSLILCAKYAQSQTWCMERLNAPFLEYLECKIDPVDYLPICAAVGKNWKMKLMGTIMTATKTIKSKK